MTKRFIFQVTIGAIFLTLNAAKDFMPMGKMHLKVNACELNLEQLLRHKSLSNLKSVLSEDELSEIKKLKESYCESITKNIK